MPIVHAVTGEQKSDVEAQEMIRRNFKVCGRFILASSRQPKIGEVSELAGLPIRVVRFVTLEEALKDQMKTPWWGAVDSLDSADYYFEVEVAD